MPLNPKITFKNLPHSDAVQEAVLDKMHLLEKYGDRITSCRVMIDSPHHHHHKGNLYRVMIDVKVPGKELVADAGVGRDHAHEDVYVAIRDAFDAMSRQLHDYWECRH